MILLLAHPTLDLKKKIYVMHAKWVNKLKFLQIQKPLFQLLDLKLHMDLFGPTRTFSLGENICTLVVVDEDISWVTILPPKKKP